MQRRALFIAKVLVLPTLAAGYVGFMGTTGRCPACKAIVDSLTGERACRPAEPGDMAAARIDLRTIVAYDLDGKAVPLADLSSAPRPVLIEIWGSRCAPCIEQRRVLREMGTDLTGAARVLSLSIDTDPRAVRGFVEKHGPPAGETDLLADQNTLRSLLSPAGTAQTAEALELPTLLLVRPDGVVLVRVSGLQSREAITADLRTLGRLNENRPGR